MPFRFSLCFLVIAFSLVLNRGLSQTRLLHGTVSGNGQPLPGVNVTIKQTTTGTVTDKDGKFSLEVPENEGVTLVLSYMGPYTERRVRKHEDNIEVKMDSNLGYHAAYLLTGPAVSKLSNNDDLQRGFVLSVGYRYMYYRFGLGAELNVRQGPVDSERGTIAQLGIPVIGYYRLGNSFRALVGGGFYLSTYGTAQNDLNVLGGMLYEKRFWAFGLRYMNGTRNLFEGRNGVAQSFQFTVQYRVN